MQSLIKIEITDNNYPQQVKFILGKKAPKFLYAMGNLNLLNQDAIGFCGSRKASEKGMETAEDCSEQAAKNDIVVISGNAAGVDFKAHYSCLKAGGKTILVIPEGMNHFRIRKSLELVWDWERVLVISQFQPDEAWKAFRAMSRNQLIIALSKAMVVIEAGNNGGTLNAGLETLRLGLKLYVAEYRDMSVDAKGNKALLDDGATRIIKSKLTNRAKMEHIFDGIRNYKLPLKIEIQQKLF